jgi:hypothetical protein
MQATTRFYTIQRVNGTGPNAKEGESGKHRHTLEESDRIKRNSVIRSLATQDREKRKAKAPVRTILVYLLVILFRTTTPMFPAKGSQMIGAFVIHRDFEGGHDSEHDFSPLISRSMPLLRSSFFLS